MVSKPQDERLIKIETNDMTITFFILRAVGETKVFRSTGIISAASALLQVR